MALSCRRALAANAETPTPFAYYQTPGSAALEPVSCKPLILIQAPSCAKCTFPWYWLADLCAKKGIPFVLGYALAMKAIHGGKAKNDMIDSHKIALPLRGGMLPQAYVYPAEMRATRDLLRRRLHLVRKRGRARGARRLPRAFRTELASIADHTALRAPLRS